MPALDKISTVGYYITIHQAHYQELREQDFS